MAKSVLITGSSKGLGRELALTYAQNGWEVCIHGRDGSDLEKVGKEIEEITNCYFVKGDIKKDLVLSNLETLSRGRDIDLLINNAAIGMNDSFIDIDGRMAESIISTNLTSAIDLCRMVYPYFVERGSGTIININGTGPLRDEKNQTIYRAAKLGLKGFTDNLRMEAFGTGVRVMGVYLDGMQTDMYEQSGKSSENCMKPSEVAEIIYNNTNDCESCYVSDLYVRRVK
jgi:short-subunit dehydrogenase